MSSAAHPLEFDTLDAKEIPAAVYLSRRAGWNVVECDWRRLHANPQTTVLTGYIDGELAATASVTCYGETLGWIGMLLVDDHWRDNGHDRAMFDRALKYATDATPAAIGLDANEQDQSIYTEQGFVEASPIERRTGTVPNGSMPARTSRITAADHEEIVAYDRHHVPVDRGCLLQQLLGETGTTGVVVKDGTVEGYAIVRPGREQLHVGPIVATTAGVLDQLLKGLGAVLEGASIVTDIIPTEPTAAAFDAVGIETERTLTRMSYRESTPLLAGPPIRSIAGFEWG